MQRIDTQIVFWVILAELSSADCIHVVAAKRESVGPVHDRGRRGNVLDERVRNVLIEMHFIIALVIALCRQPMCLIRRVPFTGQ